MGRRGKLTTLALVLALILAACASEPEDQSGGGGDGGGNGGGDAAADGLQVALLLPAVKNDLAWNQSAFEGIESLAAGGQLEFEYTEQVGYAAEDAARFARLYAERGYDLVIGHNSGYKDGIMEVAGEFPDVNFLYQDDGTVETAENVSGYNMEIWQGAYLAGIIAGATSESGRLGGVGGMAIPFCFAYFNAFLDGARTQNPAAELSTVYVGDWGDIAGAKASAETIADRGADVFIACGDGPARGVIEAVSGRGLYTFGYMHEMDVLAPYNIYGSIIWDAEKSYSMVLDDLEGGSFRPGKHYSFDLSSGTIFLSLNPNLAQQIPQEAADAVQEAQDAAAAGTLEIVFNGEEI